jgi:hypothetical protein
MKIKRKLNVDCILILNTAYGYMVKGAHTKGDVDCIVEDSDVERGALMCVSMCQCVS